jgi:UDP-N-acetylglucosamine 2-epimerase (non-hydrolysing)
VRRIVAVVGTRPEVVKMAPLVHELRRRERLETRLVSTGQHLDMSAQMLTCFGLAADRELEVMRPDQALPSLTARLIESLTEVIRDLRPDAVLVQGDTTTVLAAGLAAFYERVPLGHVEAGLRSHDDRAPWPEEMNRRVTDSLSRWCFAPTDQARENLLREGVDPRRVHVTGNTVIDALFWMRERVDREPPPIADEVGEFVGDRRLVLITGHRRESFGPVFEGLCRAVRRIADEHPDTALIYPVHLNPRVREPVGQVLGGHDRILLLEPLPYDQFVWLLSKSYLVLTDSGGVQEEAPALGKPVVVMRERSERPEGVETGNAVIVGTGEREICDEARRLLGSERAHGARSRVALPYGDGHAARRIADILLSAQGSDEGSRP